MVSVRGKRVLVFGDSLSHRPPDDGPIAVTVTDPSTDRRSAPGDIFGSWLLKAGAVSVRVNARVGRSASNFFSREEGYKIINSELAFKPQVVFVILGTNDIGLNMTADGQAMTTIRSAFVEAGADIYVVGPPSFPQTEKGKTLSAGTDAVIAMEKTVFGETQFVDARPMTQDILTWAQGRAGDGIHFQASGAQKFAERLADVVLGLEERHTLPLLATLGLGGVLASGAFALLGMVIYRRDKLARL